MTEPREKLLAATQTLHPNESSGAAETIRSYLLVMDGFSIRQIMLPNEGSVLIGRDEEIAVHLPHQSISRHHARITLLASSLCIEDLHSHNGTLVNGDRLTGPRQLLSGDTIIVGSVQMVLYCAVPRMAGPTLSEGGQLQSRLVEDIVRALRFRHPLAVVCIESCNNASFDPANLATLIAGQLQILDYAAMRGSGRLVLILPDREKEEIVEQVSALMQRLAPTLGPLRAAYALCPRDGCDGDSLLAAVQYAARMTPCCEVRDLSGCMTKHEVAGQGVVLSDPAMFKVFELVRQLAHDDLPVLVTGETGSGKELVAAALHHWSHRRDQPYVVQNCAGLPDGLADSILFGHERGAFTDAKENQPGLFERAENGTLYLDEVGEMGLSAQAKLLRVLETKCGERLGSRRGPRPYSFRIVAATNRNLLDAIKEGRFRQDLYYRLAVATIFLKPLRERPTEVTHLAQEFLRSERMRRGLPPLLLSDAVFERLHRYGWPGNVRELKNVMTLLAATVHDAVVEPWHLPPDLSPVESLEKSAATEQSLEPRSARGGVRLPESLASNFSPIEKELKELEQRRMQEALAATDGVINRAARLIEMPERTFYKRMKQYGIASSGEDRR